MTIGPNGEANCDRCGVDIGNAGLDKCVVFSALTSMGGRVETFHLCLPSLPDGDSCASRVLTKATLAWYVDNVGSAGDTPEWFTYEAPDTESDK